MTKAFEVTTQDIAFILTMHDVKLPVDVLEALHDDICNEFDEIIHILADKSSNKFIISRRSKRK